MYSYTSQDKATTKVGQAMKTYETLEAAHQAAHAEAQTLAARVFDSSIYTQGRRTQISFSAPLGILVEIAKLNSADKNENKLDVSSFVNRPLDPNHAKKIARYLRENSDDYILPPFLFNTRKPVSVHVVGTEGTRIGYTVIPEDVELYVTDGQHRIEAIKEAITHKETLRYDGACVVIVQEPELNKIHQDFVDCSTKKAVSSSLIMAFSSTDKHANFVKRFVDQSVIFKNRVDRIRAFGPGTNPDILFSLNQISACVAELLYGPVDAKQHPGQAYIHMPTPHKEEECLKVIEDFYMEYAANNMHWQKFTRPDTNKIINTRDLRAGLIHFNPIGFRLVSAVGHRLLQDDLTEHRSTLIQSLAQLDYKRTNSFWEGKLLVNGTLMPFKRTHMRNAYKEILLTLERRTCLQLI